MRRLVCEAACGSCSPRAHDANGNLTIENAGGALTTYTWDGENRLLSVTNASGAETYTYTADGLRQKKVTPTETKQYVWDE